MKRPYVLVLKALAIEEAPVRRRERDRPWTIGLLVQRLNMDETRNPFTRHIVEGALLTFKAQQLAEHSGGKWNVRFSKVLALAEQNVGDTETGNDWREISRVLRQRGVVPASSHDIVLQALQFLGYGERIGEVRDGKR